MTGELERNNRCPICGGQLKRGRAAVPFLFPNTTILIKDVPAQICSSCHEPYTVGQVTDRIVSLLNPLCALKAEVLILTYSEPEVVPVFATAEA
jgi:YgiT-type zinc finger domain-containing protein